MNRNFAGNVVTGGAPIAGEHCVLDVQTNPTGGPDPLLSDKEAAAYLGCGRSTLWRWVADGIVPKPLRIGGMSRWRQSTIEAVIAKAQAEAEAA